MELLLSFFSVLKSEINWLISLVSSANTDTDQAQADVPAAHDNPSTDHMTAGAKEAAVQDSPAADTPSHATAHAQDDQPQLPVKLADDPYDGLHRMFDDATDDATSPPHGSSTAFAFDAPGVSDHPAHSITPAPVSFVPTSFDVSPAATPATIGDLSIHPLPSFGGDASPFDGDGDGIISFRGGPSAGGGQNTGPSFTEYVTASGPPTSYDPQATGLTFKLTFDQSSAYLLTQDANFQGAVEAVAQRLAGQYDNHVTVSIDVGYNEVEGFKLGSALGESISYYTTVTGGYTALQGASNNYGSLLSGPDPLGSSKHIYVVTTAEGRALGPGVSTAAPTYDGYIGINSKQDFNLTDIANNTIPSTQYDGVGTIAHEFTEVMGRQTWNGAKTSGTPSYSPLDLFHFSSSQSNFGQHIYSGSAAGYFALHSTDWNGITPLDTALATDVARMFNTKVGDHSDWAPGTTSANPPDAYDASGGQGSVSPISNVDFLVMQAVGYHAAGSFHDVGGVWG